MTSKPPHKGSKLFEGFSIRQFDIFGQRYDFQIEESSSFTTNFGFVWSLFYATIMGFAVVYYVRQFFDKTQPEVQYNNYQADSYPKFEMGKSNLHFYMSFSHSTTRKYYTPEQVYKSFDVQASIYFVDWTELSNVKRYWEKIPLKPCLPMAWVQNYWDKSIVPAFKSMHAMCLDEEKVVILNEEQTLRRFNV